MEPNDADTARVYAFANQLAALPLAAWYEIGDAARRAEATARAATAEAILEAIIADGNLQLEQWEARDLITTAAHLVSRHDRSMTAAQRARFLGARAAAEWAALALLAGPRLPAREMTHFAAPFALHVPLDVVGQPNLTAP